MFGNTDINLNGDYRGWQIKPAFDDLIIKKSGLDERKQLILSDGTRVAHTFIIGDKNERLAVVDRGKVKYTDEMDHPYLKMMDTVAADRFWVPTRGTYKVGGSLDKAVIEDIRWNIGMAVEINPASDDAKQVIMPMHLIIISSDDLNKLEKPGEIWTYDNLRENYQNNLDSLTGKLQAFARCLLN